MNDKNINLAQEIASAVSFAGGQTYYVGGFVRDQIIGRENKDIDIEVHGIPPHVLIDILGNIGEPLMMGASFGIIGMRHYEIDISMPRSGNRVNENAGDFETFADPFIGPEKAAARRDFTMNAMMQDVLSGEILDFYGGLDDLHRRLIRHVDDKTFAEDPLRVFRAAQFAARFDFEIAEDTQELSSKIDVSKISSERIMGELEKVLLKSKCPAVFFAYLRKMKQLSCWFPEAEALIGVEQNPVYHPEGDVWNHTMQVLDQAAALRDEASESLWFLLSALCHDMGKAITTTFDEERIHAYGHDREGVKPVQRFLDRITNEEKLIKYVLNMTELHMQPNQKYDNRAHKKAFFKMFDASICPADLLLLAKADSLGRSAPDTDTTRLIERYSETEKFLRDMLAEYNELMSRPYLMGRDLLEAGVEPGPQIGKALEFAHKLRLAGLSKEEQFRQTMAYLRGKNGE